MHDALAPQACDGHLNLAVPPVSSGEGWAWREVRGEAGEGHSKSAGSRACCAVKRMLPRVAGGTGGEGVEMVSQTSPRLAAQPARPRGLDISRFLTTVRQGLWSLGSRSLKSPYFWDQACYLSLSICLFFSRWAKPVAIATAERVDTTALATLAETCTTA